MKKNMFKINLVFEDVGEDFNNIVEEILVNKLYDSSDLYNCIN